MRGCCPGSFPPRDAASGWPLGPVLTSLECEAACHAARQARGGSGLAPRPAYSVCDARLLPRQLTAALCGLGLASRP
eukprot:scaffold3637_cov90-Phaeocystis_antarctica.AAC.1